MRNIIEQSAVIQLLIKVITVNVAQQVQVSITKLADDHNCFKNQLLLLTQCEHGLWTAR